MAGLGRGVVFFVGIPARGGVDLGEGLGLEIEPIPVIPFLGEEFVSGHGRGKVIVIDAHHVHAVPLQALGSVHRREGDLPLVVFRVEVRLAAANPLELALVFGDHLQFVGEARKAPPSIGPSPERPPDAKAARS
jgi:hypothetical protein